MEVGQWTKIKQTCKSTKVTSCTYNIENGWSQVCEQKWVEMPFAEIMGTWKEVKIDRSGYKCAKDIEINELDGCIVCADVALRRHFLGMYEQNNKTDACCK